MSRFEAVVVVALATGGCVGEGASAGQQPLIDHSEEDVSTPENDAVVQTTLGTCTAIFVSPTVLLTAEHCRAFGLDPASADRPGWNPEAAPRLAYIGRDTFGARQTVRICDWAYPTVLSDRGEYADINLLRVNERVGVATDTEPAITELAFLPVLTGPPPGETAGYDPNEFWTGQEFEMFGFGLVHVAPGVTAFPRFRQTRRATVEMIGSFLLGHPENSQVRFEWAREEGSLTCCFGSGDSGGPSMWTAPGGQRYVVAVNAHQPPTSVATFHPEVGSWIRDTLDPDRDGVLVGENDVPARGDPARTAAHDIVDPDADGVTVSDNCADVYNPRQRDSDCDGRGDVCDPCPDDPGLAADSDSDGDGFGAFCDSCPDRREDPCTTDADCPGSAELCVQTEAEAISLGVPTTRVGYCLRERDSDGDRIADVCDNCPDVDNIDQRNCNAEMEEQSGLTPTIGMGDACDPTPCPLTTLPTRVPDARLLIRPTLHLRGHAGGSTRVRTASTGIRFCPCAAAGLDGVSGEAARRLCETRLGPDNGGCAVDASMPAEFDELDSPWRRTSVLRAVERPPFPPPPTPGATFDVNYAFNGALSPFQRASGTPSEVGTAMELTLRWFLEADADRWDISTDADTRFDASLAGVTWSHAAADLGCVDSVRPPPAGACGSYDQRLSSYFTSGISFVDTRSPPDEEFPPFIAPAFIPREICPMCDTDTPGFWLSGRDLPQRVLKVGVPGGPVFDAESIVTPRLANALVDPTIIWVAPSDGPDPRRTVRRPLIGFDTTAHGVRAVAQLVGGRLGLPDDQPFPPNQNPPSIPFATGLEPPHELAFLDYALAYDGAQEQLWLVARADGGGRPMDVALRYDVSAGRFSQLPLSEHLGRVESASLAGNLPLLYVVDTVPDTAVRAPGGGRSGHASDDDDRGRGRARRGRHDEDDGRHDADDRGRDDDDEDVPRHDDDDRSSDDDDSRGSGHRAQPRRLIEIDLVTGTVSVLAVGLRPRDHRRLFVRADWDGTIYLIASDDRSHRYRMGRFSRGDLERLGTARGPGTLAAQPHVNDDGITLPLRARRDGARALVGYDFRDLRRAGPPLRTYL